MATNTFATQAALEQWGVGSPAVQLTQIAAEQWATVQAGVVQLVATQVALEQWASVASVPTGAAQVQAMVMA